MKSRAFTLIELLITISIIAVLTAIALASLNSARSKGSIAVIKSNLRSMISQAELIYDAANPNSYSGVCAGAAKTITAISADGGTAACHSVDGTRWALSAKLNSDSSKNWSVDSASVVTWDTVDVSVSKLIWSAALTACATVGARVPSPEQLRALSITYGFAPPPSFQVDSYWSGIAANSADAYLVDMNSGVVAASDKTFANYVRCVR